MLDFATMAPEARPKKRVVTAEHKAAMAAGRAEARTEARVIKNYLEGLAITRPKRGRKRTPESIRARLETIESDLDTQTNELKRVALVQERIDLNKELTVMESKTEVDMETLEKGFVGAAASYSSRKGISYAAWREVGVPAAVLKAAGISRAGS